MPFSETLCRSVAAGDVPFAVAAIGNAAGPLWSGAAGDASPGRAAETTTVFRIFSMTKAIGAVAAMILIERGKLTMETEVESILPEWRDMRVLDGWDGDMPRLRPPATRATVRHLATHTSGLEYDAWNADVARHLAATGHPPMITGLKVARFYPLTFDPGTRWGYGIGMDWLGLVVEAVDGRPIDRFCEEEIFAPLGMADTRFEPEGMADRLCAVHVRGPDGGFFQIDLAPPPKPEFYGMGQALYSTAPDYLTFLRMLLAGGDLGGARILGASAVAALLADQMQGLTFRPMITAMPQVVSDVDPFPGKRTTHSFAALRNEEPVPGRRAAGSAMWAGLCNTEFWLDPASDLCGVYMTQSLPFMEPGYRRAFEAFERAAYAA
jgi:CubicO group peptidase (beta-lactamase class C family)